MIIFTIIWILLIVASAIVFRLAEKTTKDKGYKEWEIRWHNVWKRLKNIVPIGLSIILILVLLIGGVRVIDSTETGVVRTFGKIHRQLDSGLNIINPLTDNVSKYDLRVHMRDAAFASYTKDAQPVTASVEYQYQLNPARVLDIAQEYGSYEILETKLENVVQEKAKIVFARYSAMPLLENRSNLSNEVKEEVKTLEELYGVTFTSVIVKDLDFSDAFEASVEAKMTAEQDALRAEQEKKTAVVKAEQEREVATIEAEAAVAAAKGEAEAIEIKKKALSSMPDTYIQSLYIEKWDGKLPTTQAGENTAIVVTP